MSKRRSVLVVTQDDEHFEEEDTDELPAINFSPATPSVYLPKEGDVAWGKYGKYPYWPAFIRVVKKRKVEIAYLGPTIECLTVMLRTSGPKPNLKAWYCDDYKRFKEEGERSEKAEDFKEGFSLAERALLLGRGKSLQERWALVTSCGRPVHEWNTAKKKNGCTSERSSSPENSDESPAKKRLLDEAEGIEDDKENEEEEEESEEEEEQESAVCPFLELAYEEDVLTALERMGRPALRRFRQKPCDVAGVRQGPLTDAQFLRLYNHMTLECFQRLQPETPEEQGYIVHNFWMPELLVRGVIKVKELKRPSARKSLLASPLFDFRKDLPALRPVTGEERQARLKKEYRRYLMSPEWSPEQLEAWCKMEKFQYTDSDDE